ncbi:MAG: hypothetical protein H7A24_03450 [Leptospiraceae bacterium]|nr:hypothetical protein [Leptospiraceae bacterium]MCP5510906.1 hypothetical protein [Leptospiraceae bacterium]
MKRSFLLLLFLILSNCLVTVHKSKLSIPLENGYLYYCDRNSPRDIYVECREDYLAKKYIVREQNRDAIKTTLYRRRRDNMDLESWIPRK